MLLCYAVILRQLRHKQGNFVSKLKHRQQSNHANMVSCVVTEITVNLGISSAISPLLTCALLRLLW